MAKRTVVTAFLGITASLALAACGGGGGGGGTSSGSNNSSTPAVTLSPTSLTFASQTTGTSSSAQTVTVTNSGQGPLTVTAVTVTGDFSQTNTCSTVAAGGTCAISVTFKPTATGARTGTLSIADNASGSPQTVALNGTGAAPGPAVTLAPTNLSFGQQTQSTTSTAQTVTLSNSGSAALAISSVAIDNSSFQQTNNCGASVAAGSSCTLTVTFTPASAGTLSGTLSITDNAADSPQKLALSGTGVAPPITVQSFAPAAVLPGGQVTLTGTGFDATQMPLVTFAEAGGFSVQVAPTAVSATSMTVSVPPFVDASSGALASGSSSVSVSQTAAGQTAASAPLPGLAIQALPTLPSTQGRLTLDFLQATRNYLGTTLISSVQGSSLETPDLDTALANELAALDTILPGIRAVVNGQSASYTIGTYAGQNVVVTPAVLGEIDRALLGMLAAQAGSSGGTAGPPPFAAITGSSGCQSTAAATVYNDYSSNASPNSSDVDAYYQSLQAPPCAAAQAVSDGVGIVAGIGGAALGVAAVAAALLSIPAEATAAALALPAAAVLYVTVVAAGGQIAVGGALAQTSAAGKQLIEQGAAEFEKLGETMLLKAGSGGILTQLGVNDPDAWLGLSEAVVDGKEVLEAFTQAPPYGGGTPPSSTFTLSLTTAGSGSGAIASYPGTLACGSQGGSCAAGFAAGTQVFVAAVPAAGSVFTGWGGDCSGTAACSLTMSANHSVTANFGPPPGTTFTGSAGAPFNGTASDPDGGVYAASLTLAGSITLQTGGNSLLSGSANFTGQINITVVSCPASDSCSGTPFSKTVTGPISVDASGHFSANFSSGTHYPLVVTLTGTVSASGIVASGSFSTTFVGTSTNSSSQTVTVLSGTLGAITLTPQ